MHLDAVQYLTCLTPLVLKDLCRKSSSGKSLDLLHTDLSPNPLTCCLFTLAFHLNINAVLYKLCGLWLKYNLFLKALCLTQLLGGNTYG